MLKNGQKPTIKSSKKIWEEIYYPANSPRILYQTAPAQMEPVDTR